MLAAPVGLLHAPHALEHLQQRAFNAQARCHTPCNHTRQDAPSLSAKALRRDKMSRVHCGDNLNVHKDALLQCAPGSRPPLR